MKKFALLIRKENSEKQNQFYKQAIEKFGGRVVLVYDYEKIDFVSLKLTDVDGILLTGGDNVGKLDFYLIDYALKHNLKLLGICLGMQSMALYHTNHKLESIGNDRHNQEKKYVHDVKLMSSRLKDIIKEDTIKVNSHHLQTVNDSKEFSIVGISNDGLIEAIENSNHLFQIGVQWHPERMLDYDKVSNILLKCFVDS